VPAKRIIGLLVTAVLGAGLLLVGTASAAQHTRVISSCTHARYAPTHYVFFCADGGAGLRHAAYTDWTKTDAHGHGTYYWNDCKPSCAGGTIHHATAMFRLYRVRTSDKYGPLFTRIEVATAKHDYHYDIPTKTISDY
jgi:hypothetical protein